MTKRKNGQGAPKKTTAGGKPATRAATKATPSSKKATQAGKATEAGKASKEGAKDLGAKPVRNLKFHAKRLIADQFSEIMESMAERSRGGSLAHAKFLFEIGGVKEDLARAHRGKAEPSLAELLMGGIRLRQAANAVETLHPLESGEEIGQSQDEDEDRDEGAAD